MSYQTAISGLDWQMVPSGMSIPAQGIAAMQLYEQGMGAIVAGNNVGYINANIAGGNYNGSINDIVYDTIVISGSINANRTVNLYYNSGTQNGVKRYTVILASVASSGGPYTVTLTTGTGATVVVPIAASGGTVYSNPLVFMLYVDSSGNVIDGPWKISGGNTNGSYIMFDDGTMECRYTGGSMTIGSSFITGLLYDQAPSTNFPVPFIATPMIVYTCQNVGAGVGAYWAGFYKNVSPSSTVSGSPIMFGNSAGPVLPGYVAIGRWK